MDSNSGLKHFDGIDMTPIQQDLEGQPLLHDPVTSVAPVETLRGEVNPDALFRKVGLFGEGNNYNLHF